MTPDDLRAWRAHMGLSQQAASKLLDVRKQTVTDWEGGKHAPSRSVALACTALAAGLEPWTATHDEVTHDRAGDQGSAPASRAAGTARTVQERGAEK